MAKTYSFQIFGNFNQESFLLAQSALLDALKTLPEVQVQTVQLTEWQQPKEGTTPENNLEVEPEVLEQEDALKQASA